MTTKPFSHTPVLLHEAIEQINVSTGKKYIDATLGGGGHTKEIIKRGGVVLGIDQDEEALEYVSKSQKSEVRSQKLKIVKGNFSEIAKIANENGFRKVDGLLFDLGVSSHQLDNRERGFSLKNDAPLDMRMDRSSKISAYDVVNKYPKEKLIEIFYLYGEEHNAYKIAETIVDVRKKNEIKTTKELRQIAESISHKDESIHPATRIFQAIRIEVNGEIDAIKKAISEGIGLLKPNGRIVVISFHSLEDRQAKQMFGRFERERLGTVITKKPVVATLNEVNRNKRARSAKMRVFEKYA